MISRLTTDAKAAPLFLAVAAALLTAQGAVLLGLGGYSCVAGITGDPDDVLTAELIGLFALAGGAGLIGVARGLIGARRWARAPALVWQMIMAPVGVSLAAAIPGAGVALLGSAVAIVAGMFAPTSNAVMRE